MDRRAFLACTGTVGLLAGRRDMSSSATVEVVGQAVANAQGIATVTLQAPNVGAAGYLIVTVVPRVSGSTLIPRCTLYRNLVADATVLDTKSAGDRGTFTGDEDVLYMGQTLIAQWTGATVGATCTAIMRGRARSAS